MQTKTRHPGIYKREGKRGTVYQIYVWVDDPATGKRRQQVHTRPTLAEARALKQDLESAARSGQDVGLRDKTTVAEYATLFVARPGNQPSTREHQTSIVNAHLNGTPLGGLQLTKVRREHVDAWVAGLLDKLARSTVLERAGFLRSVLLYAEENRRIPRAPKVVVPKGNTVRDIHPVGTADAHRLAKAIGTPTEALMVRIQQSCGLRRAELIGLLRADVDTGRGVLWVTGQALPNGERVDRTKTPESAREVPLVPPLVEALRDHLDVTPLRGKDKDRLFLNPRTGRPFTAYTWGYRFGLSVKATPGIHPRTTPHDLRHGFAVELRRQGLDADSVGRLMGHKDGRQVATTYNGFLPDEADRQREAMLRAFTTQAAEPEAPAAVG